ncbi:MAG: hypothetical protein CR991_03115 [Proteobacteria bacterium]|nr:MAG: hypothetical protein CR991_03115 [Pseudomonadota bacterium]
MRGFSLLEVLVALVILSLSGFALYDLLNQRLVQLRQQQHIAQQLQQQAILLQSVQLLKPLRMNSPAQTQTVLTQTVGGTDWTWRSQTLDETAARGYQVGLYALRLHNKTATSDAVAQRLPPLLVYDYQALYAAAADLTDF